MMSLLDDVNRSIYKAYNTFKGSREWITWDQFETIEGHVSTARTKDWRGDVVSVHLKAGADQSAVKTIQEIAASFGLVEIEEERERRLTGDGKVPRTMYFTREEDLDRVQDYLL